MHLKLTLNGSVEPFAKYLNDFYRIRPEMLLEIDPIGCRFVCKSTTDDHTCARYSSITFEECHMTLSGHDGIETLGQNRVKAGLLSQLSTFISIIKRFGADVDDKGNSIFDIIISYDALAGNNGTTDYVATKLSCKSDVLTMRINGFRITELTYIDDERFNSVVFCAENPVSFVMDADTVESIIKNSDIMAFDARTDALNFYSKGNEIWVRFAPDKNSDPAFEYRVSVLDTAPATEINISVFKKKFVTMLSKTAEDYKVIIGQQTAGSKRILFESCASDTKIAISAVNE